MTKRTPSSPEIPGTAQIPLRSGYCLEAGSWGSRLNVGLVVAGYPEEREKPQAGWAVPGMLISVRGDVGLNHVLWPSLPAHPMGVYDAFEAPRPARWP